MRGDPTDALERPEHTGENRCGACTVANVCIAVALGSWVVAAGVLVRAPLAGVAAGGGVFVVSLLAVYLRGYLVPRTPTLTERYLPERVLRLFGKE